MIRGALRSLASLMVDLAVMVGLVLCLALSSFDDEADPY